jgi:hypothetical protein
MHTLFENCHAILSHVAEVLPHWIMYSDETLYIQRGDAPDIHPLFPITKRSEEDGESLLSSSPN